MRLTVLAISCFLSATAFAQGTVDLCQNPPLTITDRVAEHVDNGTEEPSVGDSRVGRYIMRNNAGDDVGTMFFHSHMLREPAGAHAPLIVGENIFVTDDGTIFTKYAQETPDQICHDSDHRPHELALAVIGGTEARSGVSGEIDVHPHTDPAKLTPQDQLPLEPDQLRSL